MTETEQKFIAERLAPERDKMIKVLVQVRDKADELIREWAGEGPAISKQRAPRKPRAKRMAASEEQAQHEEKVLYWLRGGAGTCRTMAPVIQLDVKLVSAAIKRLVDKGVVCKVGGAGMGTQWALVTPATEQTSNGPDGYPAEPENEA